MSFLKEVFVKQFPHFSKRVVAVFQKSLSGWLLWVAPSIMGEGIRGETERALAEVIQRV